MPITHTKGGSVDDEDIHEIRIRRLPNGTHKYEVYYRLPNGLSALSFVPNTSEEAKVRALYNHIKGKIADKEGV